MKNKVSYDFKILYEMDEKIPKNLYWQTMLEAMEQKGFSVYIDALENKVCFVAIYPQK